MKNLQLLCSDATETSIQDPPHLFVVDTLSQTIFIATSKELFSFSVADKKVRSLSGGKRASDAFHNGLNNSGRGRTKREDENASSGVPSHMEQIVEVEAQRGRTKRWALSLEINHWMKNCHGK